MLLDEVATRSDSFAEILKIVRRVAQTDANILITGETGTGKDFFAELIHDAGPRRARPFLKIDCASIPPTLAESEFFGYEKGAFSDATESKMGKLQLAERGTVYLDGINHLPAVIQSKLLRFVQERKLDPLGSSRSYTVDCRLIASSSLPVKTCLVEKQLREDLYYRLAAVTIDLPPLRERMQDIEILVGSMLEEFETKYKKKGELKPEAMRFLKSYRWPGNIRELRNVIEQAVIHSDGPIGPTEMSFLQSVSHKDHLSFAAERMLSLDELEKLYIAEVLRKVRGHQSKAAKILKINRKTLLLKKRKYGLD
jgi:transcriptional regulator with PAS, ATPase and Fis domain